MAVEASEHLGGSGCNITWERVMEHSISLEICPVGCTGTYRRCAQERDAVSNARVDDQGSAGSTLPNVAGDGTSTLALPDGTEPCRIMCTLGFGIGVWLGS